MSMLIPQLSVSTWRAPSMSNRADSVGAPPVPLSYVTSSTQSDFWWQHSYLLLQKILWPSMPLLPKHTGQSIKNCMPLGTAVNYWSLVYNDPTLTGWLWGAFPALAPSVAQWSSRGHLPDNMFSIGTFFFSPFPNHWDQLSSNSLAFGSLWQDLLLE